MISHVIRPGAGERHHLTAADQDFMFLQRRIQDFSLLTNVGPNAPLRLSFSIELGSGKQPICILAAELNATDMQTRWYPWGIQISLHIRAYGEVGYCAVKAENTQNAKICLNFYLGGGGVFWASQNWKVLKCQDLPKFQFSGGGAVILGTKSQNRVNWDFWTKFLTTPAS